MTEITQFIIVLFKSMEWFFWGAVIVTGLHLVNARSFFEAMIKFGNWMLRLHDFDGHISGNPKAFARYSRDICFLFVLNLIIVLLIKII